MCNVFQDSQQFHVQNSKNHMRNRYASSWSADCFGFDIQQILISREWKVHSVLLPQLFMQPCKKIGEVTWYSPAFHCLHEARKVTVDTVTNEVPKWMHSSSTAVVAAVSPVLTLPDVFCQYNLWQRCSALERVAKSAHIPATDQQQQPEINKTDVVSWPIIVVIPRKFHLY